MSLRFRILRITGLVLVVLVLGLYSVSRHLLLASSERLELEQQKQNMARVASALDNESADLASLVRDWAWWDDMYDFAARPSQLFIDRNLTPAEVAAVSVNLVLVVRPDGTVVYSAGSGEPAAETVLPPLGDDAIQQLVRDPTLARQRQAPVGGEAAAPRAVTGYVPLGGKLYLIASVPILSSVSTGPQHGLLIMGRLLDRRYLERLKSLTSMQLHVIGLAEGMRHGIGPAKRYSEELVSERTMAGFLRLDDLRGQPVAVLRAEAERWINRQSRMGQHYLLASLIAFLIIGVFIIVWQMERLVLRRLDKFDRLVNTIRRTEDVQSYRLDADKRDELGRLGLAINDMLDYLSENQRQLQHEASHDELTGLPNRRSFLDRLERTVRQSQRQAARVAVMAIDLDGFKAVNDNYGHNIGDQLLREVGQRLLHNVRRSDTVGRLGGDEFVIMLCGAESVGSAARIAEKIIDHLAQPYRIGGRDVRISASIGVAIHPDHGTDVDHLLKLADKLMYRAKHAGKNTCRIAGEDMHEPVTISRRGNAAARNAGT